MPKIICNDPAILTGQVGTVEFVAGVGHTDDPRMLAHFAANPDAFEVLDEDEPATVSDPESEPDDDEDEPSWSDLTDDELFEAYVLNVGEDGEAETRDDMIAALEALDSED